VWSLGFLLACRPDPSPVGEVWFGDPHAHTGVSGDGCSSDLGEASQASCGPRAALGKLASSAGLDWVFVVDHTNGKNARTDDAADADWAASVASALDDARVLAIPAAEVFLTTADDAPLGHRTVAYFGDSLSGLDRAAASPTGDLTTAVECSAVQAWVEASKARFGPMLLLPHHPAALHPMPTDWSCLTDADLGVELYSHWGNSQSWTSEAEPYADYDPLHGGPVDTTVKEGTVAYALWSVPSAQLGFFAGTDDHTTHPGSVCDPGENSRYGGGITAVVAPEGSALTRESLYDAMLARHTYATSGPRIPLAVTVTGPEGVTAGMGDVFPLDAPETVTLTLTLGDVDTWFSEIVIAYAVQPAGDGLVERRTQLDWITSGTFQADIAVIPSTAEASSYVYVELVLDGPASHPPGCHDDVDGLGSDDTERVWTSPTWF